MFLLSGAQGISVLVTMLLAGIILFRIKKNHTVRALDYPRLYWSLIITAHVFVFYVFTALKNVEVLPNLDLITWSSYLRLHSLLTFLYIEMVEAFYWWRKQEKGKPNG